MFYIYVLKSTVVDKTYTGHTEDLQKRLKEHNGGNSKFTSQYKPWKIIYTEIYKTESEAIKREKYLKSRSGRRWMKKNLF